MQRAPLLLCDRKSIAVEQTAPCDLVNHHYVGESVFLKYDSGHRWLWFKEQKVDEAIIFTSYDNLSTDKISGMFRNSLEIEGKAFWLISTSICKHVSIRPATWLNLKF